MRIPIFSMDQKYSVSHTMCLVPFTNKCSSPVASIPDHADDSGGEHLSDTSEESSPPTLTPDENVGSQSQPDVSEDDTVLTDNSYRSAMSHGPSSELDDSVSQLGPIYNGLTSETPTEAERHASMSNVMSETSRSNASTNSWDDEKDGT